MAAIRRILVTGATGKQGGALINALARSSTDSNRPLFEVIALTRNATSPSASRLTKLPNVKILQGDLDDVPAIFKQIATKFGSLYGVFSVQVPLKPRREEAQGKALADHAVRNGVEHFIYTSADRGGTARSDVDPTKVPHFISKFNIEEHLKQVANSSSHKMQWTIIRPVAFMENLTPDFFGRIFANALLSFGKTKIQLVSTESVGILAAEAFKSPEQFSGKAVSLGTDSLNFEEANTMFKRHFGHDMPRTYGWLAKLIIDWVAWKELGIMFTWIREEGFGADIDEYRSKYPAMMNFEEWLQKSSKFSKK